jgi:Carboxypeptidase regulatory-like domain/TonB-dependent Receptor Plug Domain
MGRDTSVLRKTTLISESNAMWRRVGTLLFETTLVIAISGTAIHAAAQAATFELRGRVNDEDGHPVPDAEVTIRWNHNRSLTVYSDAAGEFKVAPIDESQVSVSVSKPGFFQTKDQKLTLDPGTNEAALVLNHETEIHQQVNVASGPSGLDPDLTSRQETLVQHEILNTPVRSSHDLLQNLVPMSNVVLDTSGEIHIAGARPEQTEVLLDGFEINNPADGGFSSRLNPDALQAVTVETGGYGAQYSHAGAGLLALQTNVGDDKWRFGVTDFIPGLSIQEGLRFGTWFPRLIFSGPIKKGRAWFSEAVSVQHSFTVVHGLPGGQNVSTEWAGDNLFRVQVIVTPRNILQGTFLVNRSSAPQTGLGPFTPLSTTTDLEARRYFAAVRDQIWIGDTLLELGVADDTGRSTNEPKGNETYVVTPSSSSGNYFQAVAQQPRRLQFVGNVTSRPLKLWGTQTVSAGWNADGTDLAQQASRSEIQFVRADGTLADLATFSGTGMYRLSDTQIGGYVQDLWRPMNSIAISVAARADRDRVVKQTVVEPRVAVNWLPREDGRTKFTLSWGEFYQPINLTIFGQGLDQERTDTFYDTTGTIPVGGSVTSRFVVPPVGLLQPRSYNTAAEWNERVSGGTFVGAAYLLREGRDEFTWETYPGAVFLLQNDREDRFVSGEVWLRHTFRNGADILVDYTRSRANSNAALDPSISALIFAPQQPGALPWNAPNRVTSRGWTPLPVWHLLFSYFLEYHSGFPFSAINTQQQLVGLANSFRYPSYLSLNMGVEKRFHFHKREWAIRGAIINATDHQNPSAVVNNVDAPNFLTFSGRQGLNLNLRLRLVTQH